MDTDLFWTSVALIVVLVSLPGTVELLVLTVSALIPMRASVRAGTVPDLKIAVVVPAHNEEVGIVHCIARLRECIGDDDKVDLLVIADNCTDLTVDRALAAGVRVVVRNDLDHRGKRYALEYAFRSLLMEDFDGILVIDAGTRVEGNLIPEFRRALAAGADAVQCTYLVSSPENSPRTHLTYIAWLAFNLLRLRGRKKLGCSVGILGNGFALSRETLQAVPYQAGSVTEDLEYHLRLVRAGRSVRYIGSTTVWSGIPMRARPVEGWRTRWEGRFRLIVQRVPGLIEEVCRGRYSLIEPLFELMLLPLPVHVVLLLFALAIPVDGCRIYALFGLAMVTFHVLAAIKVGKGGWQDLATFCSVPFYVVSKGTLTKRFLRSVRKNGGWIRPERA